MIQAEMFRCCGSDILSQRGERMQRHAKGEPVFNDGFPFGIPACATKGGRCGARPWIPPEKRLRAQGWMRESPGDT